MDIILIPGMWLDGSSWERVLPVLEEAGHRGHALTLPGMESPEADRSGISTGNHVAAVIAAIDACDPEPGGVMLVGHSAGAGVAHAALDARVDRVARIVYVGGFPTADGDVVIDGLEAHGADLPLPDWDDFDQADVRDLDEAQRRAFRDRAVPSPANLMSEAVQLTDERRYDVPATIICPEFTAEMLEGWIEAELAPVGELARMRHLEYVDLPAGHWPQFTRPTELGRCLALRAVQTEVDEYRRLHPTNDADEALAALGFLDYQRATLAWKARGVDAEGLRATTAQSSLTLGGLLKHMAFVEDHWFSYWLHGRDRSSPWKEVDWSSDQDWEFSSATADTPEDLRELWNTAAARSRALVAAALAEGGFARRATRSTPDGERPNLRWIVLHMIEEYARHNGHADLLREAVDGEAGE